MRINEMNKCIMLKTVGVVIFNDLSTEEGENLKQTSCAWGL